MHGVRLVLVDNDPMALEVIELDLTLEGHEIVGTAAQGEEAVELIVESGHSVQGNPEAIEEIRRILLEHLAGGSASAW